MRYNYNVTKGGDNMELEAKMTVKPKDDYNKAKYEILSAYNTFSRLSDQQKRQLLVELFGITNYQIACEKLKVIFSIDLN